MSLLGRRRGRLRVARPPAPRRRRGIPFFAISIVIVGALVTAIVSMQALLSETSFRMEDLAARADRLALQKGRLELRAAELSSPKRIAAEARRLGLVERLDVEILYVDREG